jgi:hypothetical protein
VTEYASILPKVPRASPHKAKALPANEESLRHFRLLRT